MDLTKFYGMLPVAGIMNKMGAAPKDFDDVLLHPPTDPWWHQFGYLRGDARFDHRGIYLKWFDYWLKGSTTA